MKPEKYIDLRSDTVTKPTAAMREAMIRAEVGDDVFGEDPTVNALQKKVAALFEKEDALFVPTGVMANQLAIKVHTQPGNEIIVESESHIFYYETAAPSVLSGVQMFPLKGKNGVLTSEQIAEAIRPPAYYMPRTSLVCLENTHNMAGGVVYPVDEIREISEFVKERGISLHLDGARLWNACVATGVSPKTYAQYFDSLSVCFSKGLGAPIGSMVIGTKAMIERARTYRKIFGGGMRQVGVIAAAAEYALENNIDRLKTDHEHARVLGKGIAANNRLRVNLDTIETNIVMVDVLPSGQSTESMLAGLEKEGLLLSPAGSSRIRAVTHLDVGREAIEKAIEIFKSVC